MDNVKGTVDFVYRKRDKNYTGIKLNGEWYSYFGNEYINQGDTITATLDTSGKLIKLMDVVITNKIQNRLTDKQIPQQPKPIQQSNHYTVKKQIITTMDDRIESAYQIMQKCIDNTKQLFDVDILADEQISCANTMFIAVTRNGLGD